ncbi:MAG: hypothetical protein HY921_02480 [Elusimicrobia bacterium]|nr:hypothetical protein [Elusimicrobiota bacterium]
MILSFYNALAGRSERFEPAAPPCIDVQFEKALPRRGSLVFLRAEALGSRLAPIFSYLGYALNDKSLEQGGRPPEIYFGVSAPQPGTRIWLRINPDAIAGSLSWEEAEARGFGPAPMDYLCLKSHYRKPLDFSPQALEAARHDLECLEEIAQRLSRHYGGSAPSQAGLAGYKKRFRDALSHDLDIPEALSCLFDGLRPGALSPGSQLHLLKEAQEALNMLTVVI